MIKWFLGLSVHTLPALLLAIGERLVFTNSEFHKNYVKLGIKLRDELEELLGDDGVLIYPSHPTPAPCPTSSPSKPVLLLAAFLPLAWESCPWFYLSLFFGLCASVKLASPQNLQHAYVDNSVFQSATFGSFQSDTTMLSHPSSP